MTSSERVAVVIPVYNHVDTARAVVERARALGRPIFVVDDGSTDGSCDGLDALPGVTLLRHPTNLGKGAALLHGFREAAKVAEWAVTLDADGQHDPAAAPRLLAAVPEGARPIVVGKREGMEGPNTPWTSRFGRKFSNFWVWASGGPSLQDTQTGFRLYPLPETLTLRPRARRFQFEVEILVLAHWRGMGTMQTPVPVLYPPRGERISHFRPWVDFWRNSAAFSRLIFLRFVLPASVRGR